MCIISLEQKTKLENTSYRNFCIYLWGYEKRNWKNGVCCRGDIPTPHPPRVSAPPSARPHLPAKMDHAILVNTNILSPWHCFSFIICSIFISWSGDTYIFYYAMIIQSHLTRNRFPRLVKGHLTTKLKKGKKIFQKRFDRVTCDIQRKTSGVVTISFYRSIIYITLLAN